MSKVTKPVMLNETGIRIAEALENRNTTNRVVPLSGSKIETDNVITCIGVPEYVSDVSKYADYGITETGWYAFARIYSKDAGRFVSVTGADGYIGAAGNNYVDVAVRFEVAASSKIVEVEWDIYTERFVFVANDLGFRNLDYRVTFYVYDADDFATWHYGFANGTFVDGTKYYTKDGDTYTLAEVTADEAIPAYYTYQSIYTLTTDETFQEGVEYYTKDGEAYTLAEVTVGEAVPANTYYVTAMAYVQAEGTFQSGTVYYTKTGDAYDEAAVTVGEAIPAYYVHTKVTIEGLVRNVTYRLNEIVDCPMEFILPVIEDETHGAWFEIRCRHAGAYSMTLVPQDDAVIATEHTQKETAGVNMINLHYTVVDGVKIWRFMNTHSSIPTT